MALVVLGSGRVTREFDFVVADPGNRLDSVVDVFYGHGLELVSTLRPGGQCDRDDCQSPVASIRLRLDTPANASFFSVSTGLRIDLLFDFPVPAADLVAHATRLTIR